MRILTKNVKRRYTGTQEEILERVKNYCLFNNCVYTNLQIYNDYVTFTIYSKIAYEDLVNEMVRERYSESEEFAILRKAINGNTSEFSAYNTYVEECKTKAKEFVTNRDSLLNIGGDE